jgi:hypothetical protein
MPYKSDAQRKYFNANRDKLEAEGVDVNEWNQSSKGKKLPARAPTTKESQMQRTEAITKMAAYLNYLGNKIPVGTKAADVAKNQGKVAVLHKLAHNLTRTGNLIQAVALTYPEKSAAYRHRLVTGLVHGLATKIVEAKAQKGKQAATRGNVTLKAGRNMTIVPQKRAAGMSPVPGGGGGGAGALGMSKHPSAGVAANTSPAAAGGMRTTGPLSTTTGVKMGSQGRPRAVPARSQTAPKAKQANIEQGIQQGMQSMGDGLSAAGSAAMDPGKQKALQALLAALGVGGTAAMGATVGGAAGSVAGAERGNTPEGLGRGVIRGGATGAGAGLGAMAGSAMGQQAGASGPLPALAGAGLGGLAGYMGSGALLGQPQGGQG